ncbi:MAG: HEAT repeat domain-containing protein [Planctomycetota bacterium]
MRTICAVLLALVGCSSTPDGEPDLPDRIKEQEKGLTQERSATKTTRSREIRITEADRRDVAAIWELYRKNAPSWPRQRDSFAKRSPGAGLLLFGELMRYYMQINARRAKNGRELAGVQKNIIAVGSHVSEPILQPLVDLMILDSIQSKGLESATGTGRFITDDVTRQDCIYMLGQIGEPSVPYLLKALERDDLGPKARRFVALTLGETRSREALPTLVKLLRTDKSWQVRADAATGLGMLGDARGLGPLQDALLRDEDPAVQKRAGKARRQLMAAGR